ncbi:MAG TPA: F0F1 ATP synthase subunit epsilon [Syntrophales bacterium]|jgi:F-type H+-transporting ATPase subunit epsilon|nr:F0F1 ATP synthase subunit epsilon [Syntrophales bacterium]HPX55081.1 F0F1 ATP synthase subunit epsilon [Syntrophales bacterium]HQA82274.1 F0F1 ATP synthase subunit epsilon [Syntrophales bacterium]
MADELMLEVVTPEKMVFSGNVEEVTIPGSEGEFGVLKGHASLLSSIDVGELNYTKEAKKTHYAVSSGYVEVTGTKVTVLIETAERSDMIDKARAQRAKENAESKLAKISKDDEEYEYLRAALYRAITRLSVAEKG